MRFNSSEIIQLDVVPCWDHRVIQNSDIITTASISRENDSLYLRVKNWSNETGASTVFDKAVNSTDVLSLFLGPQNQTWVITRTGSVTNLYVIGSSGVSEVEIPNNGSNTWYMASYFHTQELEFPMVLSMDRYRISTLEFRGHAPDDAIDELWYFYTQTSAPSIDYVTLAISVIVLGIVVLVIIIWYFKK
jgi:hypothetical protein